MFTLVDGRNELYQWDLNRQVRVADPSITEVHFCNRTGDCSLVVKVHANPTDSELYADIPNLLLQSPYDIRVYAYCDCYTKVEETLKVKARTKPADYVYTPTEVLQYSSIAARMDNLENSIGDEVNKYMEEHPVQVDLTGYAKEEYVDTAISNIKFPEPDLTNYATKDYVTDQIDYYTEDFATTGYVEDKIAEIGEPDLTGYATERWVSNQGYLKTVPAQYVTEDELSAKGYAKQNELSVYAKKTDIPTVPTKVSQLENDKGYLTQHQSLAGYATTKYVDNAIANIEVSGGGDVDLSNYYKKSQTYSRTEIDNKVNATNQQLAAFNQEMYIVTDALETSIKDCATKDYVNDAISNIDIPETDLTGYATETYVDNAIAGIDIPDVSAYQTADQVNTLINNALAGIDIPEVDLGNYYSKDETYNKTEVDNAIANISGGGGSSSGGATVLTLSGTTISEVSDEDKEALIYLRTYLMENDDVPSDRLYYFRVDTSDNYHFACDITLNSIGTSLTLKSQEGTTEFSYNVSFSYSTGELTNIWTSLISASSGWRWYGNPAIDVAWENHIKIVGYWDGDTDKQVTYDISVGSEWNTFGSESGRKYYVPYYCANVQEHSEYLNGIWFYNDGSNLTLTCEIGTVTDFTPLGYWYWR